MSLIAASFLEQSEQLQRFANHLPEHPELFEYNPSADAFLPHQLDALKGRLRRQMVSFYIVDGKTPQEAQQITDKIGLFDSGVRDTTVALNGVVRATSIYRPGTQPETRLAIARNSYHVLVRYALDQHLADTTTMPTVGYNWFVDPLDLEFVDGEKPKFQVKAGAGSTTGAMECPAFVGNNAGRPRLPWYLWNGAINIYDAFGKFGNEPISSVSAAAETALSAEI